MTIQEYERFKLAVERNLNGLKFVSTGACPGCDECGLGNDPTMHALEAAGEPSFSWRECECCGSTLGGDRHPAHGVITDSTDNQTLHFNVCTDCLYYLNYGQLDDMTMADMKA